MLGTTDQITQVHEPSALGKLFRTEATMSSTNNDSKKKKSKNRTASENDGLTSGGRKSPQLSLFSLALYLQQLSKGLLRFLIGSEFKVHIPKLVLPGQLNLDVKNDIYSDF